MALSRQVKLRIRRNKEKRQPPWRKAADAEFAACFFPVEIVELDKEAAKAKIVEDIREAAYRLYRESGRIRSDAASER
jgi:hypothetical protein